MTRRADLFSNSRAKTVDMEAHDPGDVLAEIVAALAAGLAVAAGLGAIGGDGVAGLQDW